MHTKQSHLISAFQTGEQPSALRTSDSDTNWADYHDPKVNYSEQEEILLSSHRSFHFHESLSHGSNSQSNEPLYEWHFTIINLFFLIYEISIYTAALLCRANLNKVLRFLPAAAFSLCRGFIYLICLICQINCDMSNFCSPSSSPLYFLAV